MELCNPQSMSVKQESTVADQLRAVRGATDVLSILRSGSIAGKTDKIAEQLEDGVEIQNVYGDIREILATNERGETLRIHVQETKDQIKLGNTEVLEVSQPVVDVAEEVLKTATEAAHLILNEDYETASPMVEAVARSLDVKGDLQRRVNMELDVASIRRSRWYDEVVQEQYKGDEPDLPAFIMDEGDALESVRSSVGELADLLENELGAASVAFKNASGKEIKPTILDAARSVVEDMKHALRALRTADKDNEREMLKVYEGIVEHASRLVKGTRFVVQLVQKADQ
tara:strand:- start:486 stop:1343 length:858 start_codon:yes stop_codon:yes gene_type:complete